MINNPLKYANTLFELAHDNGCIDLISQQIDDLQYLHNKIPVFKMVLVTKRLKNEQKIEILKNTLKNFNSLLIELLILIINDNQINNLSMIINRFKYLSKDSSSSNTIEIISAIKKGATLFMSPLA